MKDDDISGHTISWADGEMVGMDFCEETGQPLDMMLSLGEAQQCPYCKQMLSLVWNVYVREGEDFLTSETSEA